MTPYILRVVLRSRRVVFYLLAMVGFFVANYVFRGGVSLDLNFARQPVLLPFSEMLAIASAFVGTVLLGPRFWEWDRLGSVRTIVLAGACAVLACLGPLFVTVAAHFRVPDEDQWVWAYSNALILAAVTTIFAALIGPALAMVVVTCGYVGLGVVRALWTDAGAVPITVYPDTDTHFVVGLTCLFIAASVHARLRGSSRWAWRLFIREQ